MKIEYLILNILEIDYMMILILKKFLTIHKFININYIYVIISFSINIQKFSIHLFKNK